MQAFRSCLPQLTDELEEEHYLHTSGLAAMLPWSAVRLWMPGGFLWGLAKETRTPIGINLFANPPLTDANLTVFARVRQGKSFLLKLIARRFLATHGAGIPGEKQPRRPLCRRRRRGEAGVPPAVRGRRRPVHPPRSGSPVRINPFDLPPFDPTDDDLRDPLRDHIVSLERLLELLLAERSRRLTAEEIAILDLALEATYAGEWRDAGSRQVRGGYTHDPRLASP